MFVTAVCVLFLIKLRWPKKKSIYDLHNYFVYNASCAVSRCLGRFLLSVFLDAFLFDFTSSITSLLAYRRNSTVIDDCE